MTTRVFLRRHHRKNLPNNKIDTALDIQWTESKTRKILKFENSEVRKKFLTSKLGEFLQIFDWYNMGNKKWQPGIILATDLFRLLREIIAFVSLENKIFTRDHVFRAIWSIEIFSTIEVRSKILTIKSKTKNRIFISKGFLFYHRIFIEIGLNRKLATSPLLVCYETFFGKKFRSDKKWLKLQVVA